MQVDANILQTVCDLLKPLVDESHQISVETDMVADLGLDSLKVMKLVETVEDRFDISVPLNVLPEVRTVGDFVMQIEKISRDE